MRLDGLTILHHSSAYKEHLESFTLQYYGTLSNNRQDEKDNRKTKWMFSLPGFIHYKHLCLNFSEDPSISPKKALFETNPSGQGILALNVIHTKYCQAHY